MGAGTFNFEARLSFNTLVRVAGRRTGGRDRCARLKNIKFPPVVVLGMNGACNALEGQAGS